MRRFTQKSSFVIQDFISFLSDIFTLNWSNALLRSKGFLSRNRTEVRHGWHHIKIELKKIWFGLKQLWKDAKYYFSESFKKQQYSRPSIQKDKKLTEIKQDLIKFIPFSFFLIVPGAELLLPAWIIIFPNSIPS
jgi:hypothetical protein